MGDTQTASSPLLLTKFQPPLRGGLVARPRLLPRLAPRPGVRVTLVSAPAGAGKSTLLGQWCAAGERPVAWLSLNARDNYLHRFLRYLIAALRQVEVSIELEAGEVPPSLSPPAVESLLIRLLNEVASTPEPFSLILDDYHLVTDDQIHEALLFLIEHLPPTLHLVIATRTDPPWPLARLRARQELVEIRGDDLRFTAGEIATFLNDVAGLALARETLATLEAQTEGWVAGLQLAALALRNAEPEGRQEMTRRLVDNFTAGHHFVLDYLAEEVLAQQPAAIRTFLLQTSFLERMCGSLCDAVTGGRDGVETLRHLAQHNAFVVPLDVQHHWYRYHHLFAALLQRRLRETLATGIVALYRRASGWCEAEELTEEAIVYALEADDLERAARLVEMYGMRFIASGNCSVVAEWLAALPETVVSERLQLCVFRAATAHWTGERARVDHYLRQAEKLLADSNGQGPAQILGYMDSIRAHAALTGGKVALAREMAERAVDRLHPGDAIHSQAALALGGAYWALGDRSASENAFRQAYTSALAGGHRHYAVIPASYVTLQQIKHGRLQEAAETCRLAWELGTGLEGRPLPVVGFPAIRLGDLQREWNRLDEAGTTLQEALALCQRLNQMDVLVDAYVALARFCLARADWEGAAQKVAEAERLVAHTNVDGFVISWLQGVRLRLWLATGKLAAAVQWADAAGLRPDGELSYYFDLHHIHLARLLLARGSVEGASSHLEVALGLLARLEQAAKRAGWVHELIQIHLLQARAWCERGEDASALAALAEAVRLAEPGGYIRTFVDEGPVVATLLRQARDLPAAYAGRLRAAVVGAPRSRPDPPEPLSERELEVLHFLPTYLTSTEIAETLTVSPNTVRSHIKHIYGKLGVHSRGEAVARAEELDLL